MVEQRRQIEVDSLIGTSQLHNGDSHTSALERADANQKQTKSYEGSGSMKSINLDDRETSITVTDIIGEFGLYQFSFTVVTFIRYICVAMMTNTGPLIAPDMDYYCQLPDDILQLHNKTTQFDANTNRQQQQVNLTVKNACEVWLGPGRLIELTTNSNGLLINNTYTCSHWSYNGSALGRTMTDEFELVCDRDWLRALFQSFVSIGVVLASLFWGTLSDKRGRYYTMKICFMVSLISGSVSFLAPNFITYALARCVCSLGDLGLVVSLATTLVESVGNKYRGAVCIVVYLGWGIGVMIMPWITDYFRDFRALMLATVLLHLGTLPWVMAKKECVRWLLINRRFEEAKLEVLRIVHWNKWRFFGELSQEERLIIEEQFELLKGRFEATNKVIEADHLDENKQQSPVIASFQKLQQLFESKQLSTTTLTLVWVTFNSELLYMSFILINSDVGDNLYVNYAMGGLMEILSALISCIIISNVTRCLSLASSLLCIALLCFILAFVYSDARIAVWLLSAAKLAISTLSSLVYVTATEMFPTDLRQTGFGACSTFGSMGAVVAPFICSQLVNLFGMHYILILFGLSSASAAILIPFFLRETKGVELADTLHEIQLDGKSA